MTAADRSTTPPTPEPVPPSARPETVAAPSTLAFGCGGAIGILGGLIGLGGAEFRLPVLMGLFRFDARQAVPLNLLVSLVTVAASLAARLLFARFPAVSGLWVEIAALAGGAVTAAWIGAGLLRRLGDRPLRRLIATLLLGIAGLLLLEAVFPLGTSAGLPADPVLRAAAGVLFGLAIGLVSSLLGVAGGELIIPTLLLAFGADIKTAGTASLIVSLPTVLIGVVRFAQQGAYRDVGMLVRVAAPMSAGSMAGATLGAALVGFAPTGALKAVLGAILAVSSVKMFRRERPAGPPPALSLTGAAASPGPSAR